MACARLCASCTPIQLAKQYLTSDNSQNLVHRAHYCLIIDFFFFFYKKLLETGLFETSASLFTVFEGQQVLCVFFF